MTGLLLDTHAFLWLVLGDRRLSSAAAKAVVRGDVYLSTASAWEIAVKVARGKLRLATPPKHFVPAQLKANRIEPLPVRLDHALAVHDIPPGDPFDRVIVAQAQIEGLTLVSGDPRMREYEVPILW